MDMDFTLQSSDVPVGVYNAKFTGVENTTHAEYGPGLKFAFEVLDGKFAGKTVTRTTGDKPTPKNVAGKVLAALAGTKASDGLNVKAGQYVGSVYTITVGETDNGFTRVNEIHPGKEDVPF